MKSLGAGDQIQSLPRSLLRRSGSDAGRPQFPVTSLHLQARQRPHQASLKKNKRNSYHSGRSQGFQELCAWIWVRRPNTSFYYTAHRHSYFFVVAVVGEMTTWIKAIFLLPEANVARALTRDPEGVECGVRPSRCVLRDGGRFFFTCSIG